MKRNGCDLRSPVGVALTLLLAAAPQAIRAQAMAQATAPALPAETPKESATNPGTKPDTPPATTALEGITVFADPDGYAPPSVSLGGSDLSLRQSAQSVSVVGEQQMQDLGITDARDAMRWTPGVSFGSQEEQETNSFYARGHALDNIMVDGVMGGGLPADLSLYEGVEVLRGPAGLFAGSGASGSPGGAVNLVRKRPEAKRAVGVQLAASSWDNYKTTLDVNAPWSEALRFRAIASYVDRKFFYARASRENITLGGTLDVTLSPDARLTLGLDREWRNAGGNYYGLPRRLDGSAPDYSRRSSTYLKGVDKKDERRAFIEWQQDLGPRWSLKTHYAHKKEHKNVDNISVQNSNQDAQGRDILHLHTRRSINWERKRTLDASLNGSFDLFGREHELRSGLNIQSRSDWRVHVRNPGYRFNSRQDTLPGEHFVIIDDFPWTDPDDYPYRPSDVVFSDIRINEPDRESAVYANLRLSLADSLTLTTGLRITNFREGGSTRRNPSDGSAPQEHTGSMRMKGIRTPFVALNYDLNDVYTVYASHAKTFRVQTQYGEDGNRVPPRRGANHEVGLKGEFLEARLNAMLSFYRMDVKHYTWRSTDNPCPILRQRWGIEAACYTADNQRRTEGVDFEVTGSPAPDWDIAASANWMKTTLLKYRNNGGAVSASQGQSWDNNRPSRMFKLWGVRRLNARWRVGLGAQAQNRTWAAWSARDYRDSAGNVLITRPAGRVEQGGYTLFNAMLDWSIRPGWSVQWNVDNLTDKVYLTQLGGRRMFFGEPRRHTIALSIKL